MPQEPVVTVDEEKLNDVWNEHLRAVEGDSRGIKILCRNLKDYLLGNKGDFTINRDGLVVVQALTDTEIVVSPEIERDSVKKQQ